MRSFSKLLLLLSVLVVARPTFATTYYASASGTGTTCSTGSRCTVHTGLGKLIPGDTLILANGTYTGDNGMIFPTAGQSGTVGSPITVQAENDGQVLLDGQGARNPIELYSSNNYWIIQGVNAAHGAGNDFVVGIFGGSSNNIIRRVVAWDAPDNNSCIFWAFGAGTNNNLLEDIAAFGIARKVICSTQGPNGLTVRRAFAMFNKSTYSNGSAQYDYTNAYNSFNGLFENVIGTRNEDSGTVTGSDSGIFGQDREDSTPCATAKYLGSIAYLLPSYTAHIESGLKGGQQIDCNDYENTVVSFPGQSLQTVELANLSTSAPWNGRSAGHHIYRNGTEIGRNSSLIQRDWTVTNRATGTTVDSVPNIWNGAGSSGARVCYRYQDGVLTSTPLWPWPMNQRIIDAMTTAGRTAIDVTATMNTLFGAIPSECGGSGGSSKFTLVANAGANGTSDVAATAGINTKGILLFLAIGAFFVAATVLVVLIFRQWK